MTKLFRSLKTIRRRVEKGSKEILVVAPRLGPDGGAAQVYVLSKWTGQRQQYTLTFYIEQWDDGTAQWEALDMERGSLLHCLKALKSELAHVYKGWL